MTILQKKGDNIKKAIILVEYDSYLLRLYHYRIDLHCVQVEI